MISRWIFFFACTLFALCESAFVDSLNKCAIDDGSCQKNLIENILKDISKSGVPELDIPPIDPIMVNNVILPITATLDIILDRATAKGIKNCIVDRIVSGYKEGHAKVDITCNLSIKGKFKIKGDIPLLQDVFGSNAVHGDGNFIIKIEKLHIKLDYFYDIIKKEDGNIYFDSHMDKAKYEFKVGTVKVTVKNVFLGEQDVSAFITQYINENIKSIISTFGKNIYKMIFETGTKYLHNFFERTPVKNFISTDLTPYVKN